MYVYIDLSVYIHMCIYVYIDTGWRRLIGSRKVQIIFHKRATKYKSLLRKMTYKDKGSYESSPHCTCVVQKGAVCCSVLQCVTAVCCSVLQCVTVCCSVLQCVVVREDATRSAITRQLYRLSARVCVCVCVCERAQESERQKQIQKGGTKLGSIPCLRACEGEEGWVSVGRKKR